MNNLLVYAFLIRLDHKYINELSSRDDFNNWFFMLNFVLFLFCFVYLYIFKEIKKKKKVKVALDNLMIIQKIGGIRYNIVIRV